MSPRYYTIASSTAKHPDQVYIAISLEWQPKKNGKCVCGWVSRYLDEINNTLAESSKIVSRIFIKDSSFLMPESHKTPIIMVGPGTGIVPFIGFLEERSIAKENGEELGEALLFFGCREKESDYIYRDEMGAAEDNGVISGLNIAFSRQEGEPKKYV